MIDNRGRRALRSEHLLKKTAQGARRFAATIEKHLSEIPVSTTKSSTSVVSSVVPPNLLVCEDSHSGRVAYSVSDAAWDRYEQIEMDYKSRGQSYYTTAEAAFLRDFSRAIWLEAMSYKRCYLLDGDAEDNNHAEGALKYHKALEKDLSSTPVR